MLSMHFNKKIFPDIFFDCLVSTHACGKKSFEDIRIHKLKEDRQHNGEKNKKTTKDLQNTTQKTKDRATRTSLKIGGELRFS